MLNLWLSQLTLFPRFASSIGGKGSSHFAISMLQQTMQRFLADVKVTHFSADRRDPEFAFYDQTKAVLTAYRY